MKRTHFLLLSTAALPAEPPSPVGGGAIGLAPLDLAHLLEPRMRMRSSVLTAGAYNIPGILDRGCRCRIEVRITRSLHTVSFGRILHHILCVVLYFLACEITYSA